MVNNQGLLGVQATNKQNHDLINAKKIVHQDYTNCITHCILQSPSVANQPVQQWLPSE